MPRHTNYHKVISVSFRYIINCFINWLEFKIHSLPVWSSILLWLHCGHEVGNSHKLTPDVTIHTSVTVRNSSHVMSCSYVYVYWRLGGTYSFHLRGQRLSSGTKQRKVLAAFLFTGWACVSALKMGTVHSSKMLEEVRPDCVLPPGMVCDISSHCQPR